MNLFTIVLICVFIKKISSAWVAQPFLLQYTMSSNQVRLLQAVLLQYSITCLTIHSSSELINRRWYFQSLQENSLLSLKSDVLWPFYKSAQVTLRLDILPCKHCKLGYIISSKIITPIYHLCHQSQTLPISKTHWPQYYRASTLI